MSIAIGIDLGTTNTVVGVVKDGLAQTIETSEGGRLIPSVVSFHPSGSVLVGQAARDRRLVDPENTIYSVKRLIGRPWNSEEVQQARGRFPFKLTEGPKNTTMVVARDVAYALPEISAFVLRRAKAVAEAALGETVDRAVITVPANFNDLQRASTKIAGKLAGLEVLRILNEPTAAALAYGQSISQAEKIAIYDLGGGTFDVTLLDLSGSVFEVLSTAGDTALGGDDMDMLVADKMAEQVMRQHRYDPRTNPAAIGRLRMMGELVKQQLSAQNEVTVQLADIGFGEGGVSLNAEFRMTRDELEKTVRELVARTIEVSRFSIDTIGMRIDQFDRVILVGGSTRMPLVQKSVEEFFKRQPQIRINPDEVVALGAAIQAYSLNRAKPKGGRVSRPVPAPSKAPGPPGARPVAAPAPDITLPLVGGKGAPAGKPPVPPQRPSAKAPAPPTARAQAKPDKPDQPIREFARSVPTITFSPPPPNAAPAQESRRFDPRREPDEVPAPRGPRFDPRVEEMDVEPDPASIPPPKDEHTKSTAPPPLVEGASLPAEPRVPPPSKPPAGAIATRADAPLLIDVTPLSLRVETVQGYSDALIAANTPVPCDRTKVFLTATDNQTLVYVRVAQGESNKFQDNAFLGEIELTGLPAGPRGEVRIAVTFELDADGILNVRAKDEASGREAQATLKLLGANTDAKDVEMMMARQRQHAVH